MVYDGFWGIQITVPTKGATCGLCGNNNGMRNGVFLILYVELLIMPLLFQIHPVIIIVHNFIYIQCNPPFDSWIFQETLVMISTGVDMAARMEIQ